MSKNQTGIHPCCRLIFQNFFFLTKLEIGCFYLNPLFLLKMVGLTGLEPVTLRLSSACSNQLSYRPLGRN